MKKATVILGIFASLAFASVASAGSFCIDEVGFCNDVRLKFSPAVGTSTSGFFSVNGWEYGCGNADRNVSGTMHIKGGLWYISLTENVIVAGKISSKQSVYVYNPTLKTGTSTGLIISTGGSSDISGTIAKVACPAGSSAPAFPEPDLMLQ